MMKILLINPPQPKPDKVTLDYSPMAPTLGLCYLAGSLKDAGFDVDGIDFDLKDVNINYLSEYLEQNKPEVVGISALTNTVISALTVATLTKKYSPESVIVLGGQHPTFCFEELLEYDFVDFIVLGEGEKSFLELCRAIENKSDTGFINGIAFKQDGRVVSSLPEVNQDIDSIVFPERSIFNLKKYFDPINIITSRGCSAKCIFCSASAFRDARVRFRSPDNVLKEIKLVYDQGYRVINFVDDNFMLKKQRVIDICTGIKKYFPDLFWTCSARADYVDNAMIKLLVASGCKGLHFGVETSSKESQKVIKKYLSLEKLESALLLSKKSGLDTFCSFIIGLPNESYDQVKESIKYALSLHKKYESVLVFGLLTPFPGTVIYERPEEFGIEIISRNFSDYDIFTPVIRTKYLDENQLRNLLFDAQKEYLEKMNTAIVDKMRVLQDIIHKCI